MMEEGSNQQRSLLHPLPSIQGPHLQKLVTSSALVLCRVPLQDVDQGIL